MMQQPSYTIRRATLEDVPWLRSLWNEAQLPAAELERQFIEFQVAVNETGELLGAIGLKMVLRHGHIHSEAYLHPEMEEVLRPLLWERLMILARNHGLIRFWTLEESPFWKHFVGFKEPTSAELEQMPAGFGDAHAHWTTYKLAEDNVAIAQGMTLDQHMELFRQAQEADVEKLRHRAKQMRTLAFFVVLVLLGLVVVGGVLLLSRHGAVPPP